MSIHVSFYWRHPAAWSDQPLLRRALVTAVALLLTAASAWLGYTVSLRQGIAAARAESNHRLDLFASAVNGVVKRLEPIPATIQLNQDVLALLREPSNGPRLTAVNDYLRRLNAHVGGIGAFVLNDRGVVVASSKNSPGDDSSLGEDISFRPYFLEALSGRVGRHFAIGIKGHQPGYFVSHPIHDGARVVGVAALKISLAPIDQTWEMLGAPGLLADTNQVVILASNPAWRYTALAELPLERRVDLQLTRMYNNLRVPRFPLDTELMPDDNFRMLPHGIPGVTPTRRAAAADTMVLARPLDGMDWRLMLFVDMAGVRSTALLSGFMAAVAAGFVVLLAVHMAQRRRILRQRLEAEHLLERVNAELELKVTGRTLDLTDANARLRTEVGEREQAETNLRAAQSELVHAAKMAMLGQLATSITHELTQPLGAIRTLSGNAVEFQKRGDDTALLGNLKIIARLADQMGGIIQPLKGFARKTQPVASRADVALAVGNALFLYDLPLRKEGVQVINRCVLGKAAAWCDANRLEQVLINLIGNALDAMRGATERTLTLQACTAPPPRLTGEVNGRAGAVTAGIGAGQAAAGAAAADCTAIGSSHEPAAAASGGTWIRIDVLDSGPGLSADVQTHLFEPFFTTKATGTGLGLGLVISRDIVREFGGEIEAAARPEGGARFSVYLPAVTATAAVLPAVASATSATSVATAATPPIKLQDRAPHAA